MPDALITEKDGTHSLTVTGSTKGAGLLDYLLALTKKMWLVITLTLLAGVVTFCILTVLPRNFTSVSYLALNESGAQDTEILIRAPIVLNKVEQKFPDKTLPPDAPLEVRLRSLNKKIQIVPPAGVSRKAATMFRLEVRQNDPGRARAINAALLETWLEATKPRPISKSRLEEQLQRVDASRVEISHIIGQVEPDIKKIAENNQTGDPIKSLADLIAKRDQLADMIVRIKETLTGTSTDAIVSGPSLPTEPDGSRLLTSALVMFVTAVASLLFVVLRETVAFADTETQKKVGEICRALRFWRRQT